MGLWHTYRHVGLCVRSIKNLSEEAAFSYSSSLIDAESYVYRQVRVRVGSHHHRQDRGFSRLRRHGSELRVYLTADSNDMLAVHKTLPLPRGVSVEYRAQ